MKYPPASLPKWSSAALIPCVHFPYVHPWPGPAARSIWTLHTFRATHTSPLAAYFHATATTGTRNSAEVEAVSKVLLEMKCSSCRVSQEVRSVPSHLEQRTSASSHTRWYPSYRTSSRFYQCAPWRIFRRAAWESPRFRDLHSAKELRSQLWLQPYSSGKIDTTPHTRRLASIELHTPPCIRPRAFTPRKSRHPVDDGSVLRMASHGLP